MATEVQIALQPQAGQDPAAALTAAAAKLARSSLEMLVQQAGQPITGRIVPPPANLPAGFSQVAVADMVLTLKLSAPLPAGTPVRIDVQQTPAGPPAVTVQPVAQNAAPAPALSTPSPLPLPQQQMQTPAQQVPAPQQPPVTSQPNPAPAPAVPAAAPVSQPATAGSAAPQAQPPLPGPPVAQQAAPTVAQPGPAPALAAAPQLSAPQTAAPQPAPSGPAPAALAPIAPQANTPQQAPVPVAATAPPVPTQASQPAPMPPSPQPTVQAATAQPAPQPAPPTAAPAQTLVQRLTQAFAPPPAATTAPAPPPVPGSPAQLVMAATTQAAAQQQSPAPLLQALAVSLPHLPQPVAEAAARVLASRVNLDRGVPSGETLKQAVLKSGIFLEAPAKAGSPPDLKQALGQLRSTLLAWLGDDIAPVAPVVRRPPPPTARGSMPRAQAPELPPATEAGSKEAGKSLLSQTEGALSRVKLFQLGTQPPDMARPGAALAAPSEWNLELPMMLGHELAMAQIQIQRDGKGKAEAKDKNWRLRFALKFSVLGEVGAQVTMVGARTSIAIWADEEATAETLEAMLPELGPSLAAQGLELVSLTVRRGAPRDEKQPAGRLMDSTR